MEELKILGSIMIFLNLIVIAILIQNLVALKKQDKKLEEEEIEILWM